MLIINHFNPQMIILKLKRKRINLLLSLEKGSLLEISLKKTAFINQLLICRSNTKNLQAEIVQQKKTPKITYLRKKILNQEVLVQKNLETHQLVWRLKKFLAYFLDPRLNLLRFLRTLLNNRLNKYLKIKLIYQVNQAPIPYIIQPERILLLRKRKK